VLELCGRAFDGSSVKFCNDHAADEAGEGVELIEPCSPELGDLRFRDGDAAEECESDDYEGIEERGDERTGGDCCNHLAECDGEEFGDENHEELVAGSGTGVLEAGHVIDWQEEADGTEDGVGKLGYYEGGGECELAVHL